MITAKIGAISGFSHVLKNGFEVENQNKTCIIISSLCGDYFLKNCFVVIELRSKHVTRTSCIKNKQKNLGISNVILNSMHSIENYIIIVWRRHEFYGHLTIKKRRNILEHISFVRILSIDAMFISGSNWIQLIYSMIKIR